MIYGLKHRDSSDIVYIGKHKQLADIPSSNKANIKNKYKSDSLKEDFCFVRLGYNEQEPYFIYKFEATLVPPYKKPKVLAIDNNNEQIYCAYHLSVLYGGLERRWQEVLDGYLPEYRGITMKKILAYIGALS